MGIENQQFGKLLNGLSTTDWLIFVVPLSPHGHDVVLVFNKLAVFHGELSSSRSALLDAAKCDDCHTQND